LNKSKIYWILQIAGWSFYALIHSLLIIINPEFDRTELPVLTAYNMMMAAWFLLSSHGFRRVIIARGWLGLSIQQAIPRVLLSTIALAVCTYIVNLVFSALLDIINYARDFELFTLVTYLLANSFFYLLWSAIYFMFHYLDQYGSALRYEAVKNEIELNRLKSQLNPHFMFNALNSIRALVDENPGKAKTAITQLSGILRTALLTDRQKLTGFEEELQAVKDYLDLESIRFEERLKTEFRIDPESRAFRVPPLMLQTLVENGIKHGIARLVKGGTISIETQAQEGRLIIRIRNSGQYRIEPDSENRGLGIENTRQRLKLIYGEAASFSIGNENGHTVLAEVVLPQASG
jgi:two-component system, LytTR family, sensor kinase